MKIRTILPIVSSLSVFAVPVLAQDAAEKKPEQAAEPAKAPADAPADPAFPSTVATVVVRLADGTVRAFKRTRRALLRRRRKARGHHGT